MGDREKSIAAILFLITALVFPVLLRAGDEAGPSPRMTRFFLRSALLELKLDATAQAVSTTQKPGTEGTEEPGTEGTEKPGTEGTENPGTEGTNLSLFSPDTWLAVSQEIPAPDRQQLLLHLTITCLALGRDKDAAAFVQGGRLRLAPDEPFSYLLTDPPTAGSERLQADLSDAPLPPWVATLLLDRYGGSVALPPPTPKRLQELLGPWSSRTVLFFGTMLALFLAGLALLAFSRRILGRYRYEASIYTRSMFGAPPLYTYLLFAAWFVLSTTLSMLLVPLLRESLSEAVVILLAYLVTMAVGVGLVLWRGLLRTGNLLVAVDLDGASARGRNLLLGAAGYVVAVPVVAMLTILSAILLGGGEEGINPAIPVLVEAGSGPDFWLLVVNVAVLAPLFEEFFFRGFLFQQFRKFYSTANAVLLSAAVFAAVHLSIESFLPLFGLGIILAGVYHYTRSLWASVLTHALWNLGTVIAVSVLFG
jgi:membrane protease YdiL (CAAX protease family)